MLSDIVQDRWRKENLLNLDRSSLGQADEWQSEARESQFQEPMTAKLVRR